MAKTKTQKQTTACTEVQEKSKASSLFEPKTLYARIALMLVAFNILFIGYATYKITNVQGSSSENVTTETVTTTEPTKGSTEIKPLDSRKQSEEVDNRK